VSITTARDNGTSAASPSRHEAGVVAAVARLCGLNHGTSRWWRETWFLAAVGSALPFWLALWLLSYGRTNLGTSGSLALYLSLSLWQPILEELGFRGLLQGVLLDQAPYRHQAGPLTLANVLTSIAFSIAHLPSHPLPWAIGIFAVSLLLGYARDRTGSLYPPLAFHCYFNAGYFLIAGLPT